MRPGDTPDRGGRTTRSDQTNTRSLTRRTTRRPPVTGRQGKGDSRPDAHDPAAGPQGPPGEDEQDQDAGAQGQPAATRRVHARVHDHAQEAELGAAQGRPRAPDQPDRGHRLHPRRRPQPAGALDRARARRPGEGPARASGTRSFAVRWTPRASATASRRAAGTARRRRRADMPRKGPAPRRPLVADPVYNSPAGHPAGQQDPAARQAVARREHRLRRARGLQGEVRHRPGRHAQARDGQRQADPRGPQPPCRWRDLPGAGRGPHAARRPRSACAGS